MKPFYLTKNAQGYYRAVFYNQQTGTFSSSKSTHSKDKTEAMLIAADWYKNGIPGGYTNSRLKNSDSKDFNYGLNIQNIVNRLSQNEAVLIVSLISQRFNLSAQNISLKSSVNINQEASPALVNTESKKKIVIVHRKNSLAESGMIPAEVAVVWL